MTIANGTLMVDPSPNKGYCKVTNTSPFSGKQNTIEIKMNIVDFVDACNSWFNGKSIQNAFPTLSGPEREFIKSGITNDEWNKVFGFGMGGDK